MVQILARQLLAASDLAQHAVDKRCGLVGTISLGDLDGLIDHDSVRDLLVGEETHLVDGDTQQVAVGTGHAHKIPVLGDGAQGTVDAIDMLVGTATKLQRIGVEGTLRDQEIALEDALERAVRGLGLEQQLKRLTAGKRAPR